jgi:hypothetical protein
MRYVVAIWSSFFLIFSALGVLFFASIALAFGFLFSGAAWLQYGLLASWHAVFNYSGTSALALGTPELEVLEVGRNTKAQAFGYSRVGGS